MITLRAIYKNYGLHILIWGLLLVVPTVLFHNVSLMGLPQFFFLVTGIYHIGLFYFNAYFLYPRLLTIRRWWLYTLVLAGLLAFSYYAKLFFLQHNPYFHFTSMNERVIFVGPVPFLFASIIFRFISDRMRNERMAKEAKAEHLSAELKFLRSQINPHFIFNVMTNLVSLARQKSDLLEPSLIKLSDLLRYMLYETEGDKVTVEAEIEYVRNYIHLQQLRFGEDVAIGLEIEIDGATSNIEPMLLIPFVENAFKHGIGMNENAVIDIFIGVIDKHLLLQVMNTYNKKNISKDRSSGIGLVNIKKRLQLLYPGRYELKIEDAHEIHTVELKLDL